METLLQAPPADSTPASNYRRQPPKGFNSETARAASIKGNERKRQLDALRKAHAPLAVASKSELAARLAHLRRLQRRAMAEASASTTGTDMLNAAKAAREFFEMEMELLGRRPAKAGKASKGESASVKPSAPNVQLPG